MQKPFTLSEEAMANIDNEIASLALAPGPEAFAPRKKPKVVEEVIQDRRQTHGNFRDNARLSQMLKATMRATVSWEYLDDVEKESLDMIALKISRVLSGQSLEKQHWEDIEGYAHLALMECK